MRNIAFSLTTPQFVDGTKDVTRRIGWRRLYAGDELCAVEKGMGIPKGGHVRRLGQIRIVAIGNQPLRRIIDDPAYGKSEVVREGFPQMTPMQFVDFFCASHHGVTPETVVTRIEFERL